MNLDPSSEECLSDARFQSLLVSCLEKLERGEPLDRAELLHRHPEYAQALEAFLDDQLLLRQVAGEVRDALGGGSVAQHNKRIEETIDSNPHREGLSVGDRIRYIGDYEILEEVARGGMGVVFKARQQALDRVVALKIILSGRLAGETDIERFQREARAAGRLRHPNIVPVHEIGVHDGHHYFTMEFIEGRSLSELIRDESLPPRQAAELAKTVAQAVEFAHQHDTLHRDLKPANILIDADGQPHITDFGLAKLADDTSSVELTASGQVLGTPSYMSPEQAQGRQSHIGPATDIYSLGAVLYAALTGRAPFMADTPLDTLLQVIRKEPVPLRALNPGVPRDLETICLKCLAKEPHRRYGTPQLLADDLKRFVEGRPVTARPVGVLTRTWRWARRNPVIAFLLALSVLLLLAGTALSTFFAIEANERAAAEASAKSIANREAGLARKAEQSAKQALLNEEEARREERAMRVLAEERLEARTRSLYALQLTRAFSFWKESPAEAASLLEDEIACPPRLRSFGWRFVHHLTERRLESWPTDIESVQSTADRVRAVDVSPDHSLVAAVGRGRTVFVWQRGKAEPVAKLISEHAAISAIGFSADGKRLAAAAGKRITVWNIDTVEVVHELEHGGGTWHVTYSRDGRLLVSAGAGIAVWDAASGELLRRLGDADKKISHLVVSADSQRLLTANTRGDIVLWSSDQAEPLRTVHQVGPPQGTLDIGGRVLCLDLSQDGKRFLFADAFYVHVRDLNTGAEICQVRDDILSIRAEWGHARFSPDGRWIATSSGTHPVKLWDATSGAQQFVVTPHVATGDFRFTDGGRTLLADDRAGNAVLWRVPNPSGGNEIAVRGNRVSVSPVSGDLAVYGKAVLTVLDGQSHQPLWSKPNMSLRRTAFSPTGRLLAGLSDGEVHVWDAASGAAIASCENMAHGEALVFLDEARLAFSCDGSGVAVWNRETDESFTLDSGGRGALCMAVSPDGRRLAVGQGIHPLPGATPPGKVVVWEIADRKSLATLKGHERFGVYGLAFSPDGKTLASCGDGVVLWDAATFERIHRITAHTAPVWSVTFTSDGREISTASMDATVRLWDPRSGEQRLALLGHPSWVISVAFSPDSRHMFSAGFGGDIRWWPGGELEGTPPARNE